MRAEESKPEAEGSVQKSLGSGQGRTAMEQNPTSHPDLGELDAYRTAEADAATVEHVAGCAECRATLEEIEELVALVRRSAGK